MKFYWLILIIASGSCKPCNKKSDIEAAACLEALPVEDIRNDPSVNAFLEKHPVYISQLVLPLD